MDGQAIDEAYELQRKIKQANERMRMSDGMTEMMIEERARNTLTYSPFSGERIDGEITAAMARAVTGTAWLYNPVTGELRANGDIARDPQGLLIIPQKTPAAPVNKTTSALDTQVAGTHYQKLGQYQPWLVLQAWLTPEELRGYMKGTAIAYLARERDKGGMVDIEKAAHTLSALVEMAA